MIDEAIDEPLDINMDIGQASNQEIEVPSAKLQPVPDLVVTKLNIFLIPIILHIME